MTIPTATADAASISLLQLCQISYLDPSTIHDSFPLAWPAPDGSNWSLAWGPAQDPSQANLAYVAVRSSATGQTLSVAVVVRGTDLDMWYMSPLGLWNQIVEDLGSDSQQAPPWAAPSDARIAAGTADALSRVAGMTSGGQSLVGFLAGFYGKAASSQVPLQVTGHSLGGCVTTVLAPWLQAQLAEQGLSPAIVPTTYAGPTAGNQAFADAFRSAFPTATCYRNTLDIVPKAMAELLGIPLIYDDVGPDILAPTIIASAIVGYYFWLDYWGVSYADIPDSVALPGAWLTTDPNDPLGPWLDEVLQQHETTTYMNLLGGTSVTEGEVAMARRRMATAAIRRPPPARTVSGDPEYAARLKAFLAASRQVALRPGGAR
ncbi:lipase family protein [Inquilinus sp. CA228]|uniref:lipase family protein n=1 Tax=Inquilinus sp. CA228 TaxID=3455609 RepID=UPI003F8D5A80